MWLLLKKDQKKKSFLSFQLVIQPETVYERSVRRHTQSFLIKINEFPPKNIQSTVSV